MKMLIQIPMVTVPPDPVPERLRSAFREAEPVELFQGWLPEPEPGLRPGVVRAGWEPGALLVWAELSDADVYSEATHLNDQTWEKGDVLEIFLHGPGAPDYLELHVTPNNQKLQVRVPREDRWVDRDRRHAAMERFLIPEERFVSRVWIDEEGWQVFARIPLAELGLPERPEGTELLFSFSRYDATRGGGAVLSSSSPHRELNFHRCHEWRTLRLVSGGTAQAAGEAGSGR